MSGARGRSRRYVEEEELELDPGGNMWVQTLQQQQVMHRQYRGQSGAVEAWWHNAKEYMGKIL
ncbi:hypothetical protein A2U01_0064417 [Trifolium medium]|uniref:Uncharacterized protein n=1 Tax=Trifolium medium TaxID=97028 RepID=A0A392S5A0_9FABA|nr:hypothetical protein [Trifolium medium]